MNPPAGRAASARSIPPESSAATARFFHSGSWRTPFRGPPKQAKLPNLGLFRFRIQRFGVPAQRGPDRRQPPGIRQIDPPLRRLARLDHDFIFHHMAGFYPCSAKTLVTE